MRTTTRLLFAALLLTAFLSPGTASAFGSPTAIIVDDETGEPIEGAIALAQWMKYSWLKRWGEGGTYYLTKAKETVSDKEGKTYIKGYWNDFSFSGKPHLTVYKPGYALWNSEKEISPLLKAPPKNFISNNNVVRLVKFEKAAEKWKKLNAGGIQNYPHSFQSGFLGRCLELDWEKYPITINEVFERHEGRFIHQESRRRYEKNK
jgi:hypothetical protein